MTVVLNPAGLAALFESPPVVAFMERKAREIILPAMQEDIKSYFVEAETGVENDVDIRMDGSTAIVGLQDDPQGHSNHPDNTKASRYARVGKWKVTKEAAKRP